MAGNGAAEEENHMGMLNMLCTQHSAVLVRRRCSQKIPTRMKNFLKSLGKPKPTKKEPPAPDPLTKLADVATSGLAAELPNAPALATIPSEELALQPADLLTRVADHRERARRDTLSHDSQAVSPYDEHATGDEQHDAERDVVAELSAALQSDRVSISVEVGRGKKTLRLVLPAEPGAIVL